MAGKPVKKSSLPGVSIRQLVEEIPEGCSIPDFEQKPVTLALQEGKNAIFRAVVCGDPRPEVHWQNTKGDLSSSSKFQISSAPGGKEHVLQVSKLTGEDTDLYRCVARNVYGEAMCSVRLTVIEVGFRKNRKRQKEPQEDLRKELTDFRKMLKKRAPPPAPEKKMESEQVWQLLMNADRKDYEKICLKYGIVDFRGMLRKLQEMKKEREDKMAQYVNAISNMRHIRVTKEGVATFDLELDLKDLESKIYLYKNGEMIPYGVNNQTKHCLRRLGKRYHFQIQDLQPEDAGLYQVKVEDAEVFSTELEASAIPPRVVLPLAEVQCKEQEDAIFECTLSSPCPNAAWYFQHRPLRLSDKHEVSVSPDGLTHRLLVRGACPSDMGLYSLATGLHASSAWLVVEAGKEKGLQTTSPDRQLQTQGAQASDAEDFKGISGKGGKLREQEPMEGFLEGTGPASGIEFIVGPAKGGPGRHGFSLVGDKGTSDSAGGPGQEGKGFLEAEEGRVTLPGKNQPYLEGEGDGNLPGRSYIKGESPESRLAFMERQQQGSGRGGHEDRSWGTAGSREAGYNHPQVGGLGSSREGRKPREDNDSRPYKQDQEQFWDAHLGPGTGKRALGGSQSDSERSWPNGEEIDKSSQSNHQEKREEGDGLSRESGRGRAEAMWSSRGPGEGGPGTPQFPGGGKGSLCKAGLGPESWSSQRGGDADQGQAEGYWESEGYPEQTSTYKPLLEPSLSGDGKVLLEDRSPKAQNEDLLQGTDDIGQMAAGGRGYTTGPRGPGHARGWEDSLQELQGRDGQLIAGALGRTGDGSRRLHSPQACTAVKKGTGEPGRIESDTIDPQDDAWSSLRKIGTHIGPGVLGSSEREEGMYGFHTTGLVQREDARSYRLVGSPGLGAQGSGKTLEENKGLRQQGAVGSGPVFWDGSRSTREEGPEDLTGYEESIGGLGRVGSRHGVSSGYSRGVGPGNGAACSEGSGVPGELGSGYGTGYGVISGAPVGTKSEEGDAHRRGANVPGGMQSENKDRCSPAGSGSGRTTSLRSSPEGPDGMLKDEAWNWDASKGQEQMGPGRGAPGGLGSRGTVGSVGKCGLQASGTAETTAEGQVKGGPRVRAWGQTGDYEGSRDTRGLGVSREGVCDDGTRDSGAMEQGSLRAGGKDGNGDGTRFLGARASGPGTGYWDSNRHPEAQVSHAGAASESPWAQESHDVLGDGDRSKIPGPQATGDRTAYGRGSRGLGSGRRGSGSEAVFRDGSGGPRGLGPADEASYRNGTWGSEDMGSGGGADYRDVSGVSGKIPLGNEAGYGGDLEHSGDIRHGLRGAGGMGLEIKVGYRGSSGGPEEMASEGDMRYGDGSERFGVPDSLGREAGPRDNKAVGHKSGYGTASEDGMCSKDGPGRGMGLTNGKGPGVSSGMIESLGTTNGTAHRDSSKGPGSLGSQKGPQTLLDGTSPGVDSGMARMLDTADGMARDDSPMGSGMLGMQGGPQSLSGLGDYGTSGVPEALRKSSIKEWQNGSGIPESSRDRGALRGKGRSADQGGSMGASRVLDGRGAEEGEIGSETASLEPGCEQDFLKAGSGVTDTGRFAGQKGVAPQGGEDSLLGGRGIGAGSGSSSGSGQIVDSSPVTRGRGKSTPQSTEGQGASQAWAPGWEDQGSMSAGNQLLGSRASESLQGKDVTSTGPHERQGGSRGRRHAPGPEVTDEHLGPWSLESKSSSPGRGRSGGIEKSGPLPLGKENSTEWGDGLTPKLEESGSQGAQSDLDGPFGRESSGGGSRGIQGPGCQLSKGKGGERGFPGERESMEAENGEAQSPGNLKEYEGRGAEEFGRSGKRPGPWGGRFQAQPGTEFGAAKRSGPQEARGLRQLPGGEERSLEPGSHLGGRRGTKEGRLDVRGEGRDAAQSPRSRYKAGTGSFSTEARAPRGYFLQGLADKEVRHGEAATLSCTLTSDLGPGTWFKDGVKLTSQDGVILEQDGLVHRLHIAHVKGAQAGKYTFVAGNQKSEATLTIHDPPTIAPEVTEKLREALVVKAGKPVTVKIPFQSLLPVQAAWKKDGVEVAGSSHRGAQVVLGDGYTRLCLPSAGRKDGGQYSVTLRSEGGSGQAELTLEVIDKPQPPQGPLEVQDCHRAGVCLCWRPPKDDGGRALECYIVERRQAGRSTWLKVGKLPPDNTSFTDSDVEQGRKYAYRVRAVNSEGPGEALESEEVLVAPEALPGSPSTPTILSASSQGITITWTAPRGPGSTHILGYLVEKRKKGSNTWTAVNDQLVSERRYTVADVRQGCQYEFRVTAVAPSGPGEPGPPSDAVFARDPMRPPGPVRDLQVTDTTNTSITLSWVGPDAQDGDEAQGYVVELCGSDSLQWSPCHGGTVPGTTFTAKGLRPQEGYFLRVTAVNDGGQSQPTALNTLVHATPLTVCPKFLMDSSRKDSLTVRAGDTLRVPVSFEAAPTPEVTWLKDGLPLPKRSVTTTKDGLTELLIPTASLSDSGRYTVVLRDLQGKEAAYNFLVRVAVYPQAPGPIYLQENVPGTVTVQWEPSPDEAQGIPLHYTVLMRSSSRGPWQEVADRIHTNRFTLLGVLPGHEYHFRVLAKNELGTSNPSETSEPWCTARQRDRFTVKAPSYRDPDLSQKPRFLVGLRAHLLPQGCECRMTCAVQGSPRPRVTWFKNDQSLERNAAMYSTDMLGVCSLVIPSVCPEDGGEYKAVAENPLGQAVSTATLIVIDDGGCPGSGPRWQE